jgi:hypothetical protein
MMLLPDLASSDDGCSFSLYTFCSPGIGVIGIYRGTYQIMHLPASPRLHRPSTKAKHLFNTIFLYCSRSHNNTIYYVSSAFLLAEAASGNHCTKVPAVQMHVERSSRAAQLVVAALETSCELRIDAIR